MPSLWIARLLISEATKEKLAVKHGLDWRDVVRAVVGAGGLRYAWHYDPVRGQRAVVEVTVRGQLCLMVLYPVDDPLGDVWALGSAYPRK